MANESLMMFGEELFKTCLRSSDPRETLSMTPPLNDPDKRFLSHLVMKKFNQRKEKILPASRERLLENENILKARDSFFPHHSIIRLQDEAFDD